MTGDEAAYLQGVMGVDYIHTGCLDLCIEPLLYMKQYQ